MIPIRDNIPSRGKPVVTLALIGISVAVFLLELLLEAKGELSNFLQTWAIVPERFSMMIRDAIAGAWLALPIAGISLLLSLFLHGSFAQILGNLLFLWVFGETLESKLGRGRFLALYLVGGVLTEIVQVVVNPALNLPLLGANGAIATVLGAYLVGFPRAKIDSILPLVIVFVPVELPALFYLVWWFVQQLFYGIGSLNAASSLNSTSINYWAHGIGLLWGAIAMRFWLGRAGIKRS